MVAQFLDDDHRRFLVQHLVDRDHLAELHHRLDDFRGLHRHLVRQIGDRDGFRHVHFTHDRFGRRLERGVLILMLAATLRATAPAAIDTAARIATRLDTAALRCVVLPAALAGARLLLVASRRRGRSSRSRSSRLLGCRTRRCFACRTRRLVQRALGFHGLGRLSGFRCRFRRLDLRLARRVHHFANRARFRLGGFAALANFLLFGARLFGSGPSGVFRLLRGFALRGAFRRRTLVVLFGRTPGLLGLLARRRLGDRRGTLLRRFFLGVAAFGFGRLLASLTLRFLALEVFLAFLQFLRLLGEQFGFAARFLLAPLQLGRFRVGSMIHRLVVRLVTFDEDALLAHFDLNGSSLARRVGLLDFRRVPAGQRDLALVRIGRAVRLAQVIEQARLVRFRQSIVLARFLDTGRLELLEQHPSRHFQFRGKLGYVVTRHSFLLVQGPIPCG